MLAKCILNQIKELSRSVGVPTRVNKLFKKYTVKGTLVKRHVRSNGYYKESADYVLLRSNQDDGRDGTDCRWAYIKFIL